MKNTPVYENNFVTFLSVVKIRHVFKKAWGWPKYYVTMLFHEQYFKLFHDRVERDYLIPRSNTLSCLSKFLISHPKSDFQNPGHYTLISSFKSISSINAWIPRTYKITYTIDSRILSLTTSIIPPPEYPPPPINPPPNNDNDIFFDFSLTFGFDDFYLIAS